MIDDGEVIGCVSRLLTEEGNDSPGVVIRHLSEIERIEHSRLRFVEKRDSPQGSGGGRSKSLHSIRHRLRKVHDQRFAIPSVIVLDGDRRHTVHRHDIERNLEFRYVLFHSLVGEDGFTEDGVVAQHTHLVREHDLCLEVIIRRYTRKWIVLVGERLLEGVGILFYEVLNGLVRYFCSQRKGVDEHTHGVVDTEVASSVGDGGDADVICVGEPRQRIIDGAEEHRRRCHA